MYPHVVGSLSWTRGRINSWPPYICVVTQMYSLMTEHSSMTVKTNRDQITAPTEVMSEDNKE